MSPGVAGESAPTRGRRHRPGSIYVFVLFTMTFVALLGGTSMILVRQQLRAGGMGNDADRAAVLAHAAIELALAEIEIDPTWQASFTHDVPEPERAFGGGYVGFRFRDESPDGNLATATSVRILGTGRVGGALQAQSVLISARVPLGCLGSPWHSAKKLSFERVDLTADEPVWTNKSCTAGNGADVYAAIEAAESISGGTYHGTTVAFGPTRGIPDPNSALDWYVANATPIDVDTVLLQGGSRLIRRKLLSPAHNPFGTGVTNDDGIYVIDMQGQSLRIAETRLLGTLVVVNSLATTIDDAIVLGPAVRHFPSLMVDGDLTMRQSAATLDEATAGVNFNPVGAPYGGVEDGDTADSYPSRIEGILYATGDIVVPAAVDSPLVTVQGVVVLDGQTDMLGGTVNLTYDPVHAFSPPPGFTALGAWTLVPGTWRRDAAP